MASFAGAASDISSLELAVVKEEVDLLKYQLEQVKRDNSELAKELDFSEEARQEAQKIINHRDDELRRVERRIEDLKRQRSRAEKNGTMLEMT